MFILAGYGYVGRAYYELLYTYFHTEIVDPQYTDSYISDFPFAQGLVCCVGTPITSSGRYDLSALDAVISSTPAYMPILIKSTITIEDWDYLKREFPQHSLTFSPEFLTAQRAVEDAYERNYEIVAGDAVEFWRRTFNTIKPHAWVYECEPEEAIVTKQFMNAFLATKVSFFNQIYDYCVENEIDFESVRSLMSVDKRIGASHTRVNSPRGWGGMCFPKDTEALLQTAQQSDIRLSILEEAVNYNKKIRE
jgi:UDPglucose 6-dehydrogenase